MKRIYVNLFKNNKVQTKLMLYFFLMTMILGMTSVYTYYSARTFMQKIDTMFLRDIYLNDLYKNVNSVEGYLENYLSTKHSDSLKEYIRNSGVLREKASEILKESLNSESELLLKDIGNMIDSYLTEADAAVNSKRGRNIDEYINHYTEASNIVGYINLYINRLNIGQLQENTARYTAVSSRLNMVQFFNIILIIFIIVFNIALTFWFTYKITKPITSLSRSADEISKGNFDVEQVMVDTDDEISVMANAFNRMTSSIKNYINEIKGKAELESRLTEQEMQNLIMKNLLKDAELQALQAQINPHFIFNTLNAGVQIAMMEGADKTGIFIENVSNLFRYNMKKLDTPVTLGEEIRNINNYVFVLKSRFADKIEFVQDVDRSVLDVHMPCMVLQPLVENAFIHGIDEMEGGGRIILAVRKVNGWVEVVVEDNGKGMAWEKVSSILNDMQQVYTHQINNGHTTGIGMTNVISRLRLFFNRDDIINITSSPGRGTKVVIRIPEMVLEA